MYGILRPKASTLATALRSKLSEFIVVNKGGIIIGINAMCIGIIFCDAIAIKVKINSRIYFLPDIICVILEDNLSVNPECAIVAANVPSSM